MPQNDTRIRENFNNATARRDQAMAPGDQAGAMPKEVRPNYVGGESKYHKDVGAYASKRGWDCRSNANKSQD